VAPSWTLSGSSAASQRSSIENSYGQRTYLQIISSAAFKALVTIFRVKIRSLFII